MKIMAYIARLTGLTRPGVFAVMMALVCIASFAFRHGSLWVNAGLAVIAVALIFHQFVCCFEDWTDIERASLGLIAGGMVLATPALWIEHTPFEGWSFNIVRAGVVLLVYAVARKKAHDRIAREALMGVIEDENRRGMR
jgi:hypothetical protein